MFSLYCVCLFPTALQELKVCRTDTYVIYPKHSKFMSIIIKDLSYTHTDKEVLWLSGNIWLVTFKISYLCLPLFYETRTTPSCHPSGCAYRQL